MAEQEAWDNVFDAYKRFQNTKEFQGLHDKLVNAPKLSMKRVSVFVRDLKKGNIHNSRLSFSRKKDRTSLGKVSVFPETP